MRTKNSATMRVCGISCISNMASGILDAPLSHEEVKQTASKIADAFASLLHGIITEI